MLSSQEAKAQLRKYAYTPWVKERLAQLECLPEKLRTQARELFTYKKKSTGDSPYILSDRYRLRNKAFHRLIPLSRREREAICAVLFPGLQKAVKALWKVVARLPYQQGYYRKPFRTSDPEILNRRHAAEVATLIAELSGYPDDPVWIARWSGYLGSWGEGAPTGTLLAAAIDAGGPQARQVVEVLRASATGEEEVGKMGRHVVEAFLRADDPKCWDFIQRLLLAAQRQEGLRQVILETVDCAHPEAFRRMVRLILEENLVRFSSVVRAVDVWLGLLWDSVTAGMVRNTLQLVLRFLEAPRAAKKALKRGGGQEVYFALWAAAFRDERDAVKQARPILADSDVQRRFAAAYLLSGIETPAAQQALLPLLSDEDLRVVEVACRGVMGRSYDMESWCDEKKFHEQAGRSDAFEQLEKQLPRFPKQKTPQEPILFPWLELKLQRADVAGCLWSLRGDRPLTRLIPYLQVMSPDDRRRMAQELAQQKHPSGPLRDTLFELAGDASAWVREAALQGLQRCTLRPEEAQHLEQLLKRKPAELRRGVMAILYKQNDQALLASAGRLLEARNAPQRLAGLELLRRMCEENRAAAQARKLAEQYQQKRKRISAEEQIQLEAILAPPQEEVTLENALGLMDPEKLTPPPKLRRRKLRYTTAAARACVESLAELVHRHRHEPVRTWSDEEVPLGNIGWRFPRYQRHESREENLQRFPLREVWEAWYEGRPHKLRDRDGLELVRALLVLEITPLPKNAPAPLCELYRQLNVEPLPLKRYGDVVREVIQWLLYLHPLSQARQFLLDAYETALAVTQQIVQKHRLQGDRRMWDVVAKWRKASWSSREAEKKYRRQLSEPVAFLLEADHPLNAVANVFSGGPFLDDQEELTEEEKLRLWQLNLAWDRMLENYRRQRPAIELTLLALRHGMANEHDVYEHLLGPRPADDEYVSPARFSSLEQLSGRKLPEFARGVPGIDRILQRCRERILEVELARGENPTVATAPALALRYSGGMDALFRILRAWGGAKFDRRFFFWGESGQSRNAVFSHLLRVTFPAEEDTPGQFAKKAKELKLPEQLLIDLAFFAPQWAACVERATGIPALEEAVWWIHAHTKEDYWSLSEQIREAWQAQISRRTPLKKEDLEQGAVDVAWFQRIQKQLTRAQWEKLFRSAKFASTSGGHKRAELFVSAMLGRVKVPELVQRIEQKRHQDSVRALGLVPLARGKKAQQDILHRYRVIQEFLRTSRQFGSQRQQSEKLAARIGMENLARTAGYPDPLRLQWALEQQELADLAAGPVSRSVGETTVTLAIDPEGVPELTVEKKGRRLKNIPPAVRKDEQVAQLRSRHTALRRQVSRIRKSLEEMMCRGDSFTGQELKQLMRHPMLAPMLARLVLVGEGILGYPVREGKALEDFQGKLEPVIDDEQFRIAHPVDLYASGQWSRWQHDCFVRERVQPFKQVFRELYLVTEAEKKDKTISRRYAGHQVHPRQALALLGSRGWVAAPEEGVTRTFHDQGLMVCLEFTDTFLTPAEVEGLTLEGVRFFQRNSWKPLPLAQVPPRLFSEVMRDLDLVVSVAHRGGVDPEASASTIQMRSSLLKETCTLLGLRNVRIKGNHAIIRGTLGEYSVHLGSAVVHKVPGGALCIVPVHAQHRGRLFLPFADDDPKTAEVLSKVILLAQDDQIRDPTILEQLR